MTGQLLIVFFKAVKVARGSEYLPRIYPFPLGVIRWIEAEREEALSGKGEGDGGIRHSEQALLSFGGGPRMCPGQVSFPEKIACCSVTA